MIRRPPRSTRTDTLFPYTTLFRSGECLPVTGIATAMQGGNHHDLVIQDATDHGARHRRARSEEHTSELQSLMRISYAVFCLKKKKTTINRQYLTTAETNTNIQQATTNTNILTL